MQKVMCPVICHTGYRCHLRANSNYAPYCGIHKSHYFEAVLSGRIIRKKRVNPIKIPAWKILVDRGISCHRTSILDHRREHVTQSDLNST